MSHSARLANIKPCQQVISSYLFTERAETSKTSQNILPYTYNSTRIWSQPIILSYVFL